MTKCRMDEQRAKVQVRERPQPGGKRRRKEIERKQRRKSEWWLSPIPRVAGLQTEKVAKTRQVEVSGEGVIGNLQKNNSIMTVGAEARYQ